MKRFELEINGTISGICKSKKDLNNIIFKLFNDNGIDFGGSIEDWNNRDKFHHFRKQLNQLYNKLKNCQHNIDVEDIISKYRQGCGKILIELTSTGKGVGGIHISYNWKKLKKQQLIIKWYDTKGVYIHPDTIDFS